MAVDTDGMSLMRSTQAAKYLGLSRQVLLRLADKGSIPHSRNQKGHRLFRADDLAFLARISVEHVGAGVETTALLMAVKDPRLRAILARTALWLLAAKTGVEVSDSGTPLWAGLRTLEETNDEDVAATDDQDCG